MEACEMHHHRKNTESTSNPSIKEKNALVITAVNFDTEQLLSHELRLLFHSLYNWTQKSTLNM